MTFRFSPFMFKNVPVCFLPLNFHWVNDLPNCLTPSSTSKRDSVHSSLVSQSNTSPLNTTLYHVTNATNILHNPATLKCTVYFCLSSMPKIIFLTEFLFNAHTNPPRFFFMSWSLMQFQVHNNLQNADLQNEWSLGFYPTSSS